MGKFGLNGPILYTDQQDMALFYLSCFFRSKGIAPHPTVLKLSLTVLKLSLGGYALMNQNTTKEATEAKMDQINVISIKKGSI